MKTTTIGIVGSRRRNTPADFVAVRDALECVIAALLAQDASTVIRLVSGGCPRGGDRFAERIAQEWDLPIVIHRADWAGLGRSAGFQRNGLIAQDADILIACVAADRTGGTEDTIKKFKKAHPEGALHLV